MDEPEIPEEISDKASEIRSKLLPVKSAAKYEKVYKSFCLWRENAGVRTVTEDVILTYIFNQ